MMTTCRNHLKPVTRAKDADPGDLTLQVVGLQSGGLVLDGNNDLTPLMATCMAEAISYYSISFTPTAAQDNEYRPFEVKLGKPGLIARTNSGYYGQP
jgi:hypothetical protein